MYVSPSILASFSAATVLANAAAGSVVSAGKSLTSGPDIIPYIVGGGFGGGTLYEIL